MTRSLTAPGRADAPPQTTGRHGAPPAAVRPARSAQPPKLPESRIVRRIVAGVLVGALTMFGVATLDTLTGAQVPVLGTLASLPVPEGERGRAVDAEVPPPTPGTCLTWTRVDAADATVVECAQPHLFEQAGAVILADQAVLPDDRKWRQLVSERCTPLVKQYLGKELDPNGKFRIGALKPSAAKWEDGDRELRCGLQSASRSGALYPLVGRAAEVDQSNVFQPGTCLGIDGKTVGDPADCAGPHAVETVAIVDLSTKFTGKYPSVDDQDAFLQPECAKRAAQYAGSEEAISQKKLTVYWDNLTEESWNAGSRKVNCNLAALLPDRSGFAPVTGSVKSTVQVGDQPAPPAENKAGTPVLPPAIDGPPAHAPLPGEGPDNTTEPSPDAGQTPAPEQTPATTESPTATPSAAALPFGL
ncbi:Septum formation [Pseudonocardia thermophila]|jgi:hypothetical protein|uniref:Septum formation n=1 Tax=Pseudonocardia thermophila TaxID=1848 RepID=A0A1M6VA34_PSETH|nr:septum formation family protein [Pseudonocardia thermophila]SHK78340.1 Septum formation [Pseudonocardia thermophila]